jgi:hypothetical protein
MGLFDKLKANEVQSQGEKPWEDDPAARSVGEAIADGVFKRTPALLDRLKEIGDQRAVNPPEPVQADWDKANAERKLTGTACSVCNEPQFETPGGDCCVNGHGGAAPVEAVEDKKSECPLCGKVFKHLSKHKCKGVETPAPVPASQQEGFTLILDALFERGIARQLVVLFTDIVMPLAAAVARENGQEHWGAVDYARGGPLLAAKLEKWLVETKPQGIILADSSTPELRAVKEILKRHAVVVIQGVR